MPTQAYLRGHWVLQMWRNLACMWTGSASTKGYASLTVPYPFPMPAGTDMFMPSGTGHGRGWRGALGGWGEFAGKGRGWLRSLPPSLNLFSWTWQSYMGFLDLHKLSSWCRSEKPLRSPGWGFTKVAPSQLLTYVVYSAGCATCLFRCRLGLHC